MINVIWCCSETGSVFQYVIVIYAHSKGMCKMKDLYEIINIYIGYKWVQIYSE